MRHSPLSMISHTIAFLVTITSARSVFELAVWSCKETFLVLQRDKVVFRPRESFPPKVVSAYNLNQDMVLPFLSSAPVNHKNTSLKVVVNPITPN